MNKKSICKLSCQVVWENGILFGTRCIRKGVKRVKKPGKRKKSGYRISKVTAVAFVMILVLLSVLTVLLGIRVKKLEKQIAVLKGDHKQSVEIVWSEDGIFKEDEDSEGTKDDKESLGKEAKRKVYLTFDDGPSIYTEEILKILREYDVKATFFVTGAKEAKYDKMYGKILEEGHALGIHTYSHVYSDIYSSLEAFQQDFNKLRNHIYKNTGEWVNLYRFPGGSGNNVVTWKERQAILSWMDSENIVYYDWNVAPEEVGRNEPTAQEIAKNCIEGVKKSNTAIVLLHDAGGRKSTVAALPLIIEGIKKLDDTVLLPIEEGTETFQQISLTEE